MPKYNSTFKLTVMTPDKLIYENEVHSLFITGDKGEYELMPYHYPVIGILKQGNAIINWRESIPVKAGIVRFFANDCIILIEQEAQFRRHYGDKKKTDDVAVEDENSSVMKRQF